MCEEFAGIYKESCVEFAGLYEEVNVEFAGVYGVCVELLEYIRYVYYLLE